MISILQEGNENFEVLLKHALKHASSSELFPKLFLENAGYIGTTLTITKDFFLYFYRGLFFPI